jgi:hypothetical protein
MVQKSNAGQTVVLSARLMGRGTTTGTYENAFSAMTNRFSIKHLPLANVVLPIAPSVSKFKRK